MNRYYIISIVLTFIFLVLVFLLFYQGKLYYPGIPEKFTSTTADFATLKKIVHDRIITIKNKSNIFSPYNKNNMKLCEQAIDNANTYSDLVSVFRLVPNHSIGIYPISPIKDINKSITFQFEQGILGWYWGYAVYPKQNLGNNFGTVMYYVLRNDLGTSKLRSKYKLSIGSTTVYTISLGVGIGKGKWYFCPEPIICGGTYEVNNNDFTLTCKTDNLNFSLQNNNSSLVLKFNYNNKDNSIKFGTTTNFLKTNKPRFNAPNGCAPCISGVGSLYWSYTQLSSNSMIQINDTSYSFENGDGWLDHQWGRSGLPFKLVDKLGFNVINMFKSTGKLGRYVWINLHLPDNTQYMVFCFPDDSKEAKVGDNYSSKYNVYTEKDSKLLRKGDITFEYITKYNYNNAVINFPTKLSLTVYDINNNKHVYVIDTTFYGECITIDGSGNPHWSGGAILSENNVETGTAFLELNQFESSKIYLENSLKLAGIDKTKYVNKTISFGQVIPSIIILLLPILILIVIIIMIIFGIVNKK